MRGKVKDELTDWVIKVEAPEIEVAVAVQVMVGRFIKVWAASV